MKDEDMGRAINWTKEGGLMSAKEFLYNYKRNILISKIAAQEAKELLADAEAASDNEILYTEKIKRYEARAEAWAETVRKIGEAEKILDAARKAMSPLEIILVELLYIKGERWNKVIDMLQNEAQYRAFCYEKSTYMRRHREALRKIENALNGAVRL